MLARPAVRTLVVLLSAAALASLLRGGRPSRFSPFARYAVDGQSMEPAYREGDRLFVNRLAYRRRPPAAGDVVVLHDPEQPDRVLGKRVAFDHDAAREPAGVYVLGDNAEASRDSRMFGPVPLNSIVGKAWFRY